MSVEAFRTALAPGVIAWGLGGMLALLVGIQGLALELAYFGFAVWALRNANPPALGGGTWLRH